MLFEALLDAVPGVERPSGQRRRCPAKRHADKGCDFVGCRGSLRRRGIACRIVRRGVESIERLGRRRWVIERTVAWLELLPPPDRPRRAPRGHPRSLPPPRPCHHLLGSRPGPVLERALGVSDRKGRDTPAASPPLTTPSRISPSVDQGQRRHSPACRAHSTSICRRQPRYGSGSIARQRPWLASSGGI